MGMNGQAATPKVLVVDPISPTTLERLRASYDVTVRLRPTPSELPNLLRDVDAIVLRSGVELPGHVIKAANRLSVIARAGTGTDNIDLVAAKAAGVQVFNVPSVSAQAVAELALGLVFAVARRIALADRQVRGGTWNKTGLTGSELAGKTMGVIGLGRIGSRIADLAGGIGMKVIGSVDPLTRANDPEGIHLMRTNEVLPRADVLALACPLTEDTRNLIGASELDLMMPTAYLVNIARGGVVDEAALYTALTRNRIAGAALDVHAAEQGDSRLAELDNVVLTPHIGAMTMDAQDRIGEILSAGLSVALSGDDAPTRVC